MIPLSKNRQNRIARIISLSGTCGFIVLSVIQVPRLAVHTGKLRSQQARQEEFAANLPPSDSADEILEQLNATNIELNKVKASMIDGSQLPKLQSCFLLHILMHLRFVSRLMPIQHLVTLQLLNYLNCHLLLQQ